MSDHAYLRVFLDIKTHKRGSAYWCLNTSLLEDNDYIDLIKTFWAEWRNQKPRFRKLQTWWDCGKNEIKNISIQFSTNRNCVTKQKIEKLKAEIEVLEISQNAGDTEILRRKKTELSNFETNKIRGAWIRSRFSFINESDRPTRYFFSLEKRRGIQKTMSHLKLSDGQIIDDENEIKKHARVFYSELYSPDPVNDDCQDILLKDLPKLEDDTKVALDAPFTLEEFQTAVKQVNRNKSPGIDGLPYEFYKTLWPILGQDFYDVFITSVQENELPLSCRRAVIRLLPKKGDSALLKNWRPVSLLCCDYKIFTRTLSNRLRSSLHEILHVDQTYCVPGRHISDNIRLISDTIDYANMFDVPLGIVSLDQEKAFDRVHHTYLMNTLKAFGFGEYFLKCIGTLYTDVFSLLKINNRLTAPFSFQRGIRQGCSLSGQLYAIAIEPLLHKLRSPEGISGIELPGTGGKRCAQSAYADDLNALLTKNRDFDRLAYWIDVYQDASNAKVNYQKTEGLWCGAWRGRTDAPLGLRWNSDGLKILGTFAGNNEQFALKNWEGMKEAVVERLDRWKPFARALSLRGRVLIANLLAASKLWHKLNSVSPPLDLVEDIQRSLIDFIWQGKHWVSKEIIFLPLRYGGQGLVHILSRLRDFRLQVVRRLLCSVANDDAAVHPSIFFTRYFFSGVGNLGYCDQLFLIKNNMSRLNLPRFYCDCLDAWHFFNIERKSFPTSTADVLREPLFANEAILHSVTGEPFLLESFVEAGVTTIGHLIDTTRKMKFSADDLCASFTIRSKRFLQHCLNLVWASLPQSYVGIVENFLTNRADMGLCTEVVFTLSVSHAPDYEICSNNCPKRAVYGLSVIKTAERCFTHDFIMSPWLDILGVDLPVKNLFARLYDRPHAMREGDIAWRFMHGAVSTGSFFLHAGFQDSANCHFCGECESLEHMFLYCPRLYGLLIRLRGLISSLLLADRVTTEMYIFGPWYENASCITWSKQLTNWICTQAKMAVYVTRQNKSIGSGPTNVLNHFISRLRARLSVEFDYYKSQSNLAYFIDTWCYLDILCTIEHDKLILLV